MNKDNARHMAYQRLTPIQERMKHLLTNLINRRPSNYQPPSPRINKNLKQESVGSLIHKEKVIRKKEEIVNLMGGYNTTIKSNKNYLSPSNNGKNMVMNGIQKEVNQILGNMNRIVNAQPEYLRYPKTNNDNTFLSNRKMEGSNSHHFSNSSLVNKKTHSSLNRSSTVKSSYISNSNSYNSFRPISSCPYHNDKFIRMKLGLSSL